MFRAFACFAFATFLSGQSAFEIADVHVSAPGTGANQFMRGGALRGVRYDLRNASMVDLVARAYGVDQNLVVGGPNWLEMDRFDIVAKAPENSSPDEVKTMLKALLADRFKIVVHNDTKPVPVWALTAGKHPAIKKSDGAGEKGCQLGSTGPQPAGPGREMPGFSYSCHNTTMAAFAEGIRNMIVTDQYLGGEKVVDHTGLEGSWDFSLRYTFPVAMVGLMGDAITLFEAVDKQLGLKLEHVTVPMAVIVVDSVNRKPTDNLPGVSQVLHIAPPPTEFEVAEVKLGNPDSRRMRVQIQPGGRVNMEGMTMRFLIQQAWNLTNDRILGAPKWVDTDRFEIVAKAPASPGALDRETAWVMVRALLVERFKLASHNEDRPLPAYTLVAVKPKLKPADPSSRTQFKEVTPPDAKSSQPMRFFTFQNMTMTQFAERIQRIAPGDVHNIPVLDGTELEGAWDFTLSFSPFMNRAGGGRGGEEASGPVPSASDPSGGITIFEAVEKQLGLKLQMQKRTMPVLVIDHLEQKPTEN